MELPERYRELVWPLIEKARSFLESGKSLSPIAFVGNLATREIAPVLIDTRDEDTKDGSAEEIRRTAARLGADFVFVVMEAWGLPPDKLARYEQIVEKYGSVGASPWRLDTASFMLETRWGLWGAQVPLKFKAPSKKRRTFAAAVVFRHVDGAQGRFADLLPVKSDGATLH